MSGKTTYWMADDTGSKALVEGAAERDRWLGLGWVEAGEPAGTEMVWCRHEGIADPAAFPAGVLETAWKAKGWMPGAPAEPPNPFNRDQPAAPAVFPAAESPAVKAEKPKSVAAGDKS
jgi:hypothetical protein